eukprot:3546144-Amphidinium_carterae.2
MFTSIPKDPYDLIGRHLPFPSAEPSQNLLVFRLKTQGGSLPQVTSIMCTRCIVILPDRVLLPPASPTSAACSIKVKSIEKLRCGTQQLEFQLSTC